LFFNVDIHGQVGSGAMIPLELCKVPPGQIMRKQVPPEKTKAVLDFANKKPADRLASIKTGLQVFDLLWLPWSMV
jgi:eukaryotic translation initiation factor 2C